MNTHSPAPHTTVRRSRRLRALLAAATLAVCGVAGAYQIAKDGTSTTSWVASGNGPNVGGNNNETSATTLTATLPSNLTVALRAGGGYMGTGSLSDTADSTNNLMSARTAPAGTFSPSFTTAQVMGAEFTLRGSTYSTTATFDPACQPAGTAVGTIATCHASTLTVTFSRPVTNPVIHIDGLGGVKSVASTPTTSYNLWSELTPNGFTVNKLSGASLTVASNVIAPTDTTTSIQAGACDDDASATAANRAGTGCGSVQMVGTASTWVFDVVLKFRRTTGTAVMPTTDTGANVGADGFNFAISVDEDFGDAPASYDPTAAASHVVGDLKLGNTIDADNTGTLNGGTAITPSPNAVAATGDNTGTNGDGADEDAITTFPALTTTATTYTLTVPISGASAAGQVCGWIDFDRSSAFGNAANERACTAFASGATSVALNWTGLTGLTVGTNYVRLRASYDTAGVQSPTGRLNSGEVEDYRLTITPAADLNITKISDKASYAVGENVTYTVTATNAGPAAADGAVVADTLPGQTVSLGWTCAASGGAVCPAASGFGNVNQTIATFPSGGQVTYTITALAGNAGTGIVNTATVSAPSGVTDPTTGNNSATVSNNFTAGAGGSYSGTSPVAKYATCLDFSAMPDLGTGQSYSSSVVTPEGVTVFYTVTVNSVIGTDVARTPGAATDGLRKYVPGSWGGDRWQQYFGGGKTNAIGTNPFARHVFFTLSAYAQLGGVAAPITILTGGAEEDNVNTADPSRPLEFTSSTTNGTPFAVADVFTTGGPFRRVTISGGGLTETMTVGSQDGATVYSTNQTNILILSTTKTTATAASPLTLTSNMLGNGLSAQGFCAAYSYDRGDAPTGYGTAPHLLTGNYVPTLSDGFRTLDQLTVGTRSDDTSVYLGATKPSAEDVVRGTNGSGDTDDGVATFPMLSNTSTSYSATVAYTNASGGNATLSGWIDFNRNGAFDAGEKATATAVPGTSTYTLSWTGLSGVVAGQSYARFRISTDATGAGLPTGTSPNGEVEDYALTINAAPTTSNVTNATLLSTAAATTLSPNLSAADTDGTVASYTIVTLPAAASGVLALNGTAVTAGQTFTAAQLANLTFDPAAGYGGTATFTYSATDNQGAVSNTSTYAIPVNLVADLSVTKTDGLTTVNAGGTTTYTIRVTNAGPDATTATLTDPAVSGLNVTAVGCSATPGRCTTGTTPSISQLQAGYGLPILASGDTYELTVTATVTATSGSVTNTATVAVPAGTVDGTNANNAATDTNTVTPVADLAVDKSGPVAVSSGVSVTYTIRVWNNGPSTVTGATVTDTLPAGFTVTNLSCAATGAATCGSTATSGSTVTFTTGNLPLDTTTANATPDGNFLTFTVTGTAPASGSLVNAASVAAPGGTQDTVTVNNTSATVVTRVVDAVNDAGVNLSVGAGGTVSVLGNDTVGSVAATTTNAAVSVQNDGGITGLTVNSSGQIVVPTTAPAGTYTVTYKLCDVTVTTACDTATVPVTVVAATADVTITKTGPAYAKPAEDVTYTLTVSNSGAATAAAVSVTDTLPPNMTYKSSNPAATVSGQNLTWSLGSLASGASQTLTVVVTAPTAATLASTPAARTLTNTATVSTTSQESNSGNNSASAVTQMVEAALSKTVKNVTQNTAVGTTGGGKPGEVLEYCIAFENIGGAALPNFVVTDQVPGNTTAQLTGFDAEEPSAATGFGVKLTRGAATPTTSYLTSAADATDTASLSDTAGTYGRGTLSVNLGSLGVGEKGSVCFRTTIR